MEIVNSGVRRAIPISHIFAKKTRISHILALDKITEWHLHGTLNEGIWPKFSNFMKKVPFWQFFRIGRDGRAG